MCIVDVIRVYQTGISVTYMYCYTVITAKSVHSISYSRAYVITALLHRDVGDVRALDIPTQCTFLPLLFFEYEHSNNMYRAIVVYRCAKWLAMH